MQPLLFWGNSETKRFDCHAVGRELFRFFKAASRVMQFLSTHPADEARVATIKAQARGTESALTKAQWQAL